MNNITIGFDQNEEAFLIYEIPDEVLENIGNEKAGTLLNGFVLLCTCALALSGSISKADLASRRVYSPDQLHPTGIDTVPKTGWIIIS
jgi:hypothetical protein